MPLPGKAKTGLLLFLTAGPFLVFLFLHLFGKNHYEIDQYGLEAGQIFSRISVPESAPFVVYDYQKPSGCSPQALENQRIRITERWKYLGHGPKEFEIPSPLSSSLPQNPASVHPAFQSLFFADTVLELKTAKGPGKKRLPEPPRALLFDEKQNLRGIYGLCSRSSVDTLLLEYSILTD